MLTPAHREKAPPIVPRAKVMRLDNVPSPDYVDYFSTLEQMDYRSEIVNGIPVEMSRGCWWGAKHHCTFCGLNGGNMDYRSKDSQVVLDELQALKGEYGIGRIMVVDNILDMAYFRSVLPKLAEEGSYSLFFEIKSNLRKAHVELLAKSGARWVQPGLESLHDEVLKLMDKGTTALINLQFLKWCEEQGVRVFWNFLSQFPGERDFWYREMAAWLPSVFHLQPPHWIIPIRYDRFSPYHSRSEEYGVKLTPHPAYGHVYPLEDEAIEELAYFFRDAPGSSRTPVKPGDPSRPGLQALQYAVTRWRQAYDGPLKPTLHLVEDSGERLLVKDTRGITCEQEWELEGVEREVLLACDSVQGEARLAKKFDLDPEATVQALDKLERGKLILRQNGRSLSLVMGCPRAEVPPFWEGPGGYTRQRYFLVLDQTVCTL